MPAGRPKKYDPDDITAKLKKYIDDIFNPKNKTAVPKVIDFIVGYGISKSHFYELAKDNQELSDTIKRLIDIEERYLVDGAEFGKINSTFAIFRLKQKPFNWTDKQEIKSENDNTIRIVLDDQIKEWAE